MTFKTFNHHSMRVLAAAAAGLLLAAAPARAAGADVAATDPILVQRGNAMVRKSDFDAELLRIPEKDRAEFVMSARRVREFIDRMMMTLELAAAAKAKGLDKDPALVRRFQLEQDKVLAQTYLADVEATAGREFDANPGIEAAARERYVVDRATYSKPESANLTQINFRFDGNPDEAKARADAAYAKLKAGADMGDLAQSLAENPTIAQRRGFRGSVTRADVDPALVLLVFDGAKVGEINPPVRTSRNWAIVRVDQRTPALTQSFDDVRAGIIARLREDYISSARDSAMAALGGGQKSVVNEAAIEALRTLPGAKN